jgi:hypothetical protein
MHRPDAAKSGPHEGCSFPNASPLLLELWREQHPLGHEQIALNFLVLQPVLHPVPLFSEDM